MTESYVAFRVSSTKKAVFQRIIAMVVTVNAMVVAMSFEMNAH
jgi:hypothetical protein